MTSDPSCQMKLLRVLQDQTFEVLGDSRPRKTDIRVVSATNADLHKMVGDVLSVKTCSTALT